MRLIGSIAAVLTNRRFVGYFVLPNLAFLVVSALTSSPALIAVLNLIVVALSVNVCIAFGPNVLDAIFGKRAIDKADLLSLGIFCSWFALVLRTVWSLVWRWFGQPLWLTNTAFSSYFIFIAACGAVFHLAAPGSVKESVPPLRWVKIGAWIALGVFVGLLLLYASDLQDKWHDLTGPNDRASTPSTFVLPL